MGKVIEWKVSVGYYVGGCQGQKEVKNRGLLFLYTNFSVAN